MAGINPAMTEEGVMAAEAVIAGNVSDEAIQSLRRDPLDCVAALAMTLMRPSPPPRGRLTDRLLLGDNPHHSAGSPFTFAIHARTSVSTCGSTASTSVIVMPALMRGS